LWVVCAAVVIAPTFAPFGSIAPFDQERMLQLGACGIALALSASNAGATRRVTSVISGMSPLLRGALAGAFAFGSLSAILGPHPRASFVEVAELAIVVLSVFAVAGAVREDTPRAIDLIAWALAAGATVAVVDLTIRIAALESAGTSQIRPTALFEHFQNPRFFAQWMTWVLPLLAIPRARAARAGSKLLEAVVWITWATCWAFAFLAAGRGTFAAQGVATLIVLAVFRRNALPWARTYAAAALAGIVVYFASALLLPRTWSELSQVVARLSSVSDSGRFEIWLTTMRMIVDAPLLGAGPRALSYDLTLPVAHPHNSVLQWASEWGVPAMLLAVCSLLYALAGWTIRRRTELSRTSSDTVIVVSLTTALVGAALHSLLCGVLVMPISQLMLVVTAGCALGIDSVPRSRAIAPGWWASVVAFTMLVWVVASRVEIERVIAWTVPPNIQELNLRPRIWHDETSVLGVLGATQPARRPPRRQ